MLDLPVDTIREPGSNNWVVGSAMSPTGKPIVSNDPHRAVTNPSLRYIVHLNAPGWNAIGATQPPFVGVSMGHNEKLAWGLTITGTDFQDVFIEDLNPANANEIIYNGKPEPLKIVTEEFQIKGEAPRKVDLKFSRHGPIFYVDETNHKAYALRSIFSEPGTASYLGSLKLDQSQNCKEFLDLAMFWKANSENLICGDVDGHIGFQASALTPNRKGWLGRLPVPGTGRYEWDGFRSELPKEYDPPRGFIATANHNINTKGYWPPVVFKTTNTVPYDRITRLLQVHHACKDIRDRGLEEAAARRVLASRRRRSEIVPRLEGDGRDRRARARPDRHLGRRAHEGQRAGGDLHHVATDDRRPPAATEMARRLPRPGVRRSKPRFGRRSTS